MACGARASGERVVSATGATGPAEGNVTAVTADAADRQPTQTELENERGAATLARRHARIFGSPKKPNGAAPAIPFPSGETIDTGAGLFIVPNQPTAPAIAFAGLPMESLAEGITLFPEKTATKPIESVAEDSIKRETPPAERSPEPKIVPEGAVPVTAAVTLTANKSEDLWNKSGRAVREANAPPGEQPGPNAGQAKQSGTSPSLVFLDNFFGSDKRHLVAIKKYEDKKTDIKAHHFDAADRNGQQKFITDYTAAGFDLYFSPNPIKGTLNKKAKKNDVAEARHLWIDLDPRPGEPLEAERATMLALLTTNLPQGIPRPNRVIDSGRGFWGYWKLATPQPVDGSTNNVNGPLTEAVECYGRGIEQAFGDHFADGCRNIDRIARLPGTVNTKTGNVARVLHEFSYDEPHPIEGFPRGVEKPDQKEGGKFKPPEKYEPIEPDDPLLAKLGEKWLAMLTAADYAAVHGGDRSRAEIALAAVAMRAGIDDGTIARCLMDERRQFGSNTRASERLLTRVIEKAHQYADNPVLERMNRDFAAGFIGSKFRVAKFDLHPRYPLQRNVEFISKDDFINGVRNPLVEVPKFDKAGKTDGTKMEPRGAYWFGLSGRGEFDAVTFKPGAPPIIEVERRGGIHRTINTYSGFSVVPDHVNSAAKCTKYLAHIHDNIAGGNEALYKYLLDWMASGVQHPDDPGRSALSLRGVPGCGKGVFALTYGQLFGKHFLHATHRDHVIGKFNAHQAETCLIFVDEALYAEIAADAQILKTMTSETTKLLERKGIDATQIDNFARQIFATNDEHPIQIEHNDRRYPAIYVQENKAFAKQTDELVKAGKRRAYFMPILDELKHGGSAALLGFLLDRDIRNFNAEAIPETAERRQQKLKSASAGDKIIIEFAQDACLPGALQNRPWIARAHADHRLPKHYQPSGLFDVMQERGGTPLARKSDPALADIIKPWGFKTKSLGTSRGWEAPPLLHLRKAILTKYPAVEFDDRTEWVPPDAPDEEGQGAATIVKAPQPAQQTVADIGKSDDADVALDERLKNISSQSGPDQTAAILKLARDKTLI